MYSFMQVKRKRDSEDIRFSPSDEFGTSPKKAKSDHMAAPDLLQPLEDEAVPLSAPLSSQEDEAKRSRLEKVQRAQFNLKRKAEPPSDPEPAAKMQNRSPDDNFGIEFEP